MLFLCTGNYYRSRFAEILFNALAADDKLGWQADSRGIATEFGVNNMGPISPHTLKRLAAMGIVPGDKFRPPLHLLIEDLVSADLVVALNEPEHRPLLEARFPGWQGQVEYWCVADLNRAGVEEALATIEAEVRALVERLSTNEGDGTR